MFQQSLNELCHICGTWVLSCEPPIHTNLFYQTRMFVIGLGTNKEVLISYLLLIQTFPLKLYGTKIQILRTLAAMVL